MTSKGIKTMGPHTSWIPDGLSLDRPSAARIYDYWLGGYHNFEIDRVTGDKVKEIYLDTVPATYVARALLRRVVRFVGEQGIEQFLDIGSGIPTVGNVHEAAQRTNPDARVVYVDIDPVAVAHARAILVDNPNATAIREDAGRPEQILGHPEVRRLLDFDRPVAVLFLAVLHFVVEDDRAYNAVYAVRDAIPAGSYIAVSHATYEGVPEEPVRQMQRVYEGKGISSKVRARAEVLRFFEGLELIEPGMVYSPLWRPEGPDDIFVAEPSRAMVFAGVGRKP
jgi:SAM-dependent methyltransferase